MLLPDSRERGRRYRAVPLCLLLATVVLPAAAATAGAAPSGQVAVVGGTLIDGTGAPPRADVTILVDDGRITRVGGRSEVAVPAGATVIDARGKFVLPGLIDAHLHYRDYYAELLITHGITAGIDWGGSPVEWTLAQKEGVEKGKLYGPRLYTCGEMIDHELGPAAAAGEVRRLRQLGTSHVCLGYDAKPDLVRAVVAEARPLGMPVSGYPARTRAAIGAGIDAIKHTYVIGSANAGPERLDAIVRQIDLPSRSRDPRLFLLGDDHDPLVKLMASEGVVWIPTLAKDFKVIHDRRNEFEQEGFGLLAHPELQYLPVDNLVALLTNRFDTGLPVVASGIIGTVDTGGAEFEAYRRGYRNLQAFMRKFVAAGGRVLAGTAPHSFVLPGLALHQELQLFVDAGLTPMQAIQSATSWAAEYVRAGDEIGTVEEGKLADLILLLADPLQDIRNTRAVETVMQGGRILPTGYHRSYVNPIPRSTSRNAPGAGHPRPELAGVTPAALLEGAGATQLHLHGRAFAPGAFARFETVPLETTFVSATELIATVPEHLLTRVGTFWITVSNPRPGGGESTAAPLIVKYR